MNLQHALTTKWGLADFVRLENTGQFAVKWSANEPNPWIIAVDLNDCANIGTRVSEEYIESNRPTLIGFKGSR